MAAEDVTRVRELCNQLLRRAEADPAAARALADDIAKLLDDRYGTSTAQRRGGRRAAPVLDPFDIHREDPATLASRLAELDVDQLRDVVAHYGMDPRRLAMKWKSSDRLVAHIVQTVETRRVKGDAFRAPNATA